MKLFDPKPSQRFCDDMREGSRLLLLAIQASQARKPIIVARGQVPPTFKVSENVGRARGARPKRRSSRSPQIVARDERFAELLSEGVAISEIQERLNLTKGQAMGIFHRMKASLGWQAQ